MENKQKARYSARMILKLPMSALLCALLCAGCAGNGASPTLFSQEGSEDSLTVRAEQLLAGDPAGSVPAPEVPPDLRAVADALPQPMAVESIPYNLECLSPEAPDLAEAFTENALLYRLQDQPVHTLTGLEQRLSSSLDTGGEILRSFGYYAGKVRGTIIQPQEAEQKILVRVEFTPGPRYQVGKNSVAIAEPESADATVSVRPAPAEDVRPLPTSLAEAGLKPSAPAAADDVLAAVDQVQEEFRNRGYPFASIASTRYVLDHEAHELEAEVRVTPGDFARMGELDVGESPPVAKDYFDALRPWRVGRPWSDRRIQSFRERLQQSGLFQSIEITPGDVQESEYGEELRTVKLDLVSAPERTVGGALKYDSSFGPGVQGFWEHRNFTGHADLLRLEMPLWMDMQELTANYRRPFLFSDQQDFIASAGLLNQDTDAYEIQSGAVAAGFERRFSREWRGSLQASAEGGWLKDPDEPRRQYMLFGLPGSITYSTANSLLNATRGVRLALSLAPYTGEYGGPFTALRGRLDAFAYLPAVGEDELVIAVRGSYGVLYGATAPEVPPTVRFYSGGGGSVRGYAYQSLGPRNADDDPLGGDSLIELSGELRWKLTETWGLVAFLDGGMAFDSTTPGLGTDLRWGAGLGVRYYTAIGPVRLDVAVPVNPRSDDDSFQFYISIGQSF